MIRVYTDDPARLRKAIKAAIDDQRVKTWTYDDDGDFTHTAEQWRDRAWLHPVAKADLLALYIVAPQSQRLSSVVYAVYHGRFIEMLLSHFDQDFSRAAATALPEGKDVVD